VQRNHETVELTAKVLVGQLVIVVAQNCLALGEVPTELSGFFPAALTDANMLTLRAANGEADAASGTRLRVNRLHEVRKAGLADFGRDCARGLTAFKGLER